MTGFVAIAQDEETAPAPTFGLGGSIDTYFRSSEYAPGTSFANLPGFAMGMANLIVSYEGEKSGFVADLVFGPRGADAVFGSPQLDDFYRSSNIVNQLYAYYNVSDSFTLTMGVVIFAPVLLSSPSASTIRSTCLGSGSQVMPSRVHTMMRLRCRIVCTVPSRLGGPRIPLSTMTHLFRSSSENHLQFCSEPKVSKSSPWTVHFMFFWGWVSTYVLNEAENFFSSSLSSIIPVLVKEEIPWLTSSQSFEDFTIFPKRCSACRDHRVICVDKLEFNQDGTIKQVKMTFEGISSNDLTTISR